MTTTTMRWTAGVAACALAAVALGACTGTTGSASSGDVAAARAKSPNNSGTSPGGTSGGGTATGSLGGAVAAGPVADATRLAPQLILTGGLSVVVRSVDRSARQAEAIASGAGGRTDADTENNPRGPHPSADLTLRVPNPALPTVLDRLAALGRETDQHLSTQDITTQVADVTSRVASARAAITSLRALYAKATRVSDIIRIESSLSQREAALESLQARQRSLSGQVALATITLELTQHRAAAPPPARSSQRTGFVGGLDRGWHAFTAAAGGLAVALGAALPFVLLLVVLAALGLIARRRLRPRPVIDSGSE